VTLARPHLKEAVSKTLAWRTETRGGAAAARHHFRGWGGDVSSPWPPSPPKTFWDETSQPHPDPQLPRGRRRLVAVTHPAPKWGCREIHKYSQGRRRRLPERVDLTADGADDTDKKEPESMAARIVLSRMGDFARHREPCAASPSSAKSAKSVVPSLLGHA